MGYYNELTLEADYEYPRYTSRSRAIQRAELAARVQVQRWMAAPTWYPACRACGKQHHIQRCPKVAELLMREDAS